ncbi:hypothetical protein K2X33_01745, partial [bacterium]|nr:hypothetical protein [bacterium]
ASELAEFFVSHKPERLRANLSTNPVNGTFGAYKFCAHINLLDRTTGNILNRDPLADIPQPSTLSAAADSHYVNRFYIVNILDMTTLTTRDVCNKAFSDNTVTLANTERYMVTVGVTWKRLGTNDLQREVVSAVIPQS